MIIGETDHLGIRYFTLRMPLFRNAPLLLSYTSQEACKLDDDDINVWTVAFSCYK